MVKINSTIPSVNASHLGRCRNRYLRARRYRWSADSPMSSCQGSGARTRRQTLTRRVSDDVDETLQDVSVGLPSLVHLDVVPVGSVAFLGRIRARIPLE